MTGFQIVNTDERDFEDKPRGVKMRFWHGAEDLWLEPADGEGPLELFEVKLPANFETPQHAHPSDEIIYVLEGSIRLGSKECRAGGSVLVPANTLYRFIVGPDGCRFLNFRPRPTGSILKEEFLAARTSRGSSS